MGVLNLFAHEDVHNGGLGDEFDGHFADNIQLRVVSVGRASAGSPPEDAAAALPLRLPPDAPVSPFVDPERPPGGPGV
jgi:hypothetical protein